MQLIEKILLATDFMEAYENVVDNAVQLAKNFEAEIVPLHVLPADLHDEKLRRLVEQAARDKLNELRQQLIEQNIPTAEPLLEVGRPYNKIVETAHRDQHNIIVIGAGAKKKKDKFQLGTTAEKIIRWSDKPVWVVKKDKPLKVRTILCPVDFSEPSTLALKNAIVIARRFEAELVVLSVYEHLSSRGAIYYQKEWDNQSNQGLVQYKGRLGAYLSKHFNWHKVKWKRVVKAGIPEEEILSAINEYKADLLIMGTTGRSGLSKFMMGSVTEKVIREVPCTFITTKSEDIIKLRLENTIKDIDNHYQLAQQLVDDGFFEEAEHEYNQCLAISPMHLPSINGLAKLYKMQDREKEAKKYRNMAKDVLKSIWNVRIEEEIRKGLG